MENEADIAKKNFDYFFKDSWENLVKRAYSENNFENIALRSIVDLYNLCIQIHAKKGLIKTKSDQLFFDSTMRRCIITISKGNNENLKFDRYGVCIDFAIKRFNRCGVDIKYQIINDIPVSLSLGTKINGGTWIANAFVRRIDDTIKDIDKIKRSSGDDLLTNLCCDISKTILSSRKDCDLSIKKIMDWAHDEDNPLLKTFVTIAKIEKLPFTTMKNINILTVAYYLAIFGYRIKFYSDDFPYYTGEILNNKEEPKKETNEPWVERVYKKYIDSNHPFMKSTGDWYKFISDVVKTEYDNSFEKMISSTSCYNLKETNMFSATVYKNLSKVEVKDILTVSDELGYKVIPKLNFLGKDKMPNYSELTYTESLKRTKRFPAAVMCNEILHSDKYDITTIERVIYQTYMEQDLEYYKEHRESPSVPKIIQGTLAMRYSYRNISLILSRLARFAETLGYELRLVFVKKDA